MSFLTAQKKFRAIKKALTEENFFVFKSKLKGPIMKLINNRGRFASALAVIAIALALVACGGGGEVETLKAPPVAAPSWNQPAQPLAAGTPAAKEFAAALKKSGPLARAQAQAANPDPFGNWGVAVAKAKLFAVAEDATINGYGIYFYPPNQVDQEYGPVVYRFYPGRGYYLAMVKYTGWESSNYFLGDLYVMGAEFGNTPTFVGTFNQAIPANPGVNQVVMANADSAGWYPFRITITSGAASGNVAAVAEKAINDTSFQFGAWPLFNCEHNTVLLSGERVKLNCVAAIDSQRHNLIWDPTTNRITEYDGSEGPYPDISDPTWVAAQTDTPPVEGWGSFAEMSVGHAYVPGNSQGEIHFKRRSDGQDTTLLIDIGLVKAMAAFTKRPS
jgi:hypothetical protein